MIYNEDKISRTAGIVYEKADWETWLFYPRGEKYTSFVDIMEPTIFSEEEDPDFSGISLEEVIKELQNYISKN